MNFEKHINLQNQLSLVRLSPALDFRLNYSSPERSMFVEIFHSFFISPMAIVRDEIVNSLIDQFDIEDDSEF